jgi:translocation and assembly module TamA
MILPLLRCRPMPWIGVLLVGFAVSAVTLTLPAAALDARLDGPPEGEVRDAIQSGSLVLAAAASDSATAQDVVAAARADYANILGILYGAGYYGGRISILVDGREVANLSPFSVPARVGQVLVKVDPGRQFTFGRANIGPLAPDTVLPDGFRPGAPAKADLIRESVGAASDAWREIGHAKAGVAGQKIVARHPAAELDADIAIDPGPRLRFGALTVAGNEKVRTDRILEIAGLPGGKVFSPEKLDAVARRLRKTGAFSSVALEEAKRANPDGTLDIGVSVVEQPPRRIGFGAEISSAEGLTVSAYWMHRNILRGAERLRFDAEATGIGIDSGSFLGHGTGIDYRLAASFARPGTFAAANTLTARVEASLEDEPTYYKRAGLVELGLERELSARTRITAALQYRYTVVDDGLARIFMQRERRFSLLSLPLTGEIDARDAPLNPTTGYFLRLEATPYLGFQNADSGARFYGDGRYYRGLGADNRVVLAGRLQFGSVVGSSIAGTPPDFLFFSGGGGTVRGQSYKSLKVDLGGGVSSGGRSYLGLSAEARVRVGKKISLVGFYDYGAIGAGSMPGDGGSHSGAGLGLRYDTPLGPIRLDVAAPVSGGSGGAVQIYVGIGQAF